MKVYITHCCAKKDDGLKGSCRRVAPDELYVARPTKRFMEVCKARSVRWAILSDKYGVWFSDVKQEWYEEDPNSVSEQEFIRLLHDFDNKLEPFEEIWFYYNPGQSHSLYARLLEETKLRDKVKRFTHLVQIRQEGAEMDDGFTKPIESQSSSSDLRSPRVGLSEAAQILSKLKICKAYGPTGKINGPNCQRFGHRDTETRRWYWDLAARGGSGSFCGGRGSALRKLLPAGDSSRFVVRALKGQLQRPDLSP